MKEYEFDLMFCYKRIKAWKAWYMRKNSKHNSTIQLRVFFAPEQQCFWEYYLELEVNGKIIEKNRIRREAYDTLSRDPDLKRIHYTGLEFVILEEFKTSKKSKN